MRHTVIALAATLSLAVASPLLAQQKVINQLYAAEKALNRIQAPVQVQGLVEVVYNNTTVGGPTWNRPFANCSGLSGLATATPYHVQQFSVTANGNYLFTSAQTGGWDGYLMLYQTNFSAATPLINCLGGNDDGPGGLGTSEFTFALTAGTQYFLVTTGFDNTEAGAFTNEITGPGTVNLGGGPAAVLTLDKTAPEGVRSAGPFPFVITVANTGTAAANSVVVTDPLPGALTYLSNTCGASVTGNDMTWTVGTLANGASTSCTVIVQLTAGSCAAISNTATVNATGLSPVTATYSNGGTNVIQDGALSTGGAGGSPWTSTSTNFGNVFCTTGLCGSGGAPPTAGPRSAEVWAWFGGSGVLENGTMEQTVNIPAGATSLNFWFWPGLCANGASDFIRVLVGGTERWRFDATGTCGSAVGYSLQSVPLGGVTGNTVIRFESTTIGTGGTTNFNVDDVSLTGAPICSAPAFTDLALTITGSQPSEVFFGQNVTFVATVTNNGPAPATNVVVNGTLSSTATIVSTTCGATQNGINTQWLIGNLANGASATCTITARVNAVGAVRHEATVSADGTDPVPANNTSGSTLNGFRIPIPTLDMLGMLLMALALGGIGLLVARRRG